MRTSTRAADRESMPSERARALEDAFRAFSRHTVTLQQTYRRLREEAARLNLELEQTNRMLERKVRELDELSNFQQSILSSVPVAVVVTDLDGTIKSFNVAAERMWGVSAGEAVGRSYRQVMQEQAGLLSGVLKGRNRRDSVRRPLGEDNRIISSTACLVEDSEGRPIGAVQLDKDVTRLHRLEEHMCRRQKLAELGKMAAGFAHEVRKPLNGIKGFASLLRRRYSEDEEGCRYAGRIIEAAERLHRMLARMMGFASPGGLNLRPCNLSEQAHCVADLIRFEDPDSNLNLHVAVPESARCVQADADKLQQILLNLVKNAAEAVEATGEVVIHAYAESSARQECVHVRVADTGCGIARTKLDRITEPFVSETQGGTGLGLAVVERLLRLHETSLTVESEPGVGTVMEFVLQAPDRTGEDD